MKRQTSAKQQSWRKLNGGSRSSERKKSNQMPERGVKVRARERRNSEEFRRKTRLQALQEKRLNAANTGLEFSEVSIQTLHSICAPAAISHKQARLQVDRLIISGNSVISFNVRSNVHFPQAKNSLLSNISSSQSLSQQDDLGLSHLSMVSGSKTCFSRPIKAAEEQAYTPPKSARDAVEELWLEVSVEIDHGINLVVDLNLDRKTAEWLDLERNYRMLVPQDKAVDDSQMRCGTDGASDSADVASLKSGSSAELPQTENTVAQYDNQLTTHGITQSGDAGSKIAQVGVLAAACVPVESQESSTSGIKELTRHEGFSFASLERMPTFLTTGFKEPLQSTSCGANGSSDWMVFSIEV
ncbi:hypothetical protein L7F22_062017 [Adiantum nelumboides]|nr:hypothetical protein [Adiantum nelumboides]